MTNSRMVYVTYIQTTPDKLWQALLEPEFTRRYWFAAQHESEWTPGAPWLLRIPDGRVAHSGEVLEIDPPRKLVLAWQAEVQAELKGEGPSRVTFELEPQEGSVKLTVVHETDQPDSKLVKTLSTGWPLILASLKSLLETGESLVQTRRWPQGL